MDPQPPTSNPPHDPQGSQSSAAPPAPRRQHRNALWTDSRPPAQLAAERGRTEEEEPRYLTRNEANSPTAAPAAPRAELWGRGRCSTRCQRGDAAQSLSCCSTSNGSWGSGASAGALGIGPKGGFGLEPHGLEPHGLELWVGAPWVGAHDLKDVGWGRGLESKGCSLWAEALGLGLPVGALGFLWGLAAPIAAQPQPRAELCCSAAGHQRAPKGRGAKQGAELISEDPQPPISPTRPPPPPSSHHPAVGPHREPPKAPRSRRRQQLIIVRQR